jgi:hypothetical protein
MYAGPPTQETRGKNAGIVQDETIARPQVRRKIAESAILPAALGAMEHQHARGGAIG